MVENTQRIRQALRGIRGFLQGDNAGPAIEFTTEGTKA
jgi:alanine-synthesizing transaminase